MWSGLIIPLFANAGSENLSLTGNLMQGGLAFGQVNPDSKVWANGHPVRVSPAGEFILGFGRDYPPRATVTVQTREGTVRSHTFEIAGREYDTQRIDGLPNVQVNPGPQIMRRIRRESAEIAAARSLDDDRMDFKSGFIWPVQGRISGIYGSQRILNGQPRQPHYGIDIAAPVGTKVLAPAPGRVIYAEDMYFSGGTLVVDHGQNLSSSFLHLHEILVEVDEYVKQGQPIALVGATGRVTGPHLDWRMNWHQQRLDPSLLMGEMPPES
ncbi:MAG: M23 family metallopeptidase [Proteobacteria bacterium]|nr:M23 family metallopeptidase [Pseudomonadota bacterium]